MKALVVHAHPLPESFSAALRDRVVAGLEGVGHDVVSLDLHDSWFEPRLALNGGFSGEDESDLQPHIDNLAWAEAVVMVYPTWWGAQPAILKGWFDRLWAPRMSPTGESRPDHVRGVRRLVVVTTYGSSRLFNALHGEAGKRTVRRTLRSLLGRRARSSWIALYGMDGASESRRRRFLDRVERSMSKL